MKRLVCVSVFAMIIPAVVGCGCFQQPEPQVIYKPVYVPAAQPALAQPAPYCPPPAVTP